MYYVNYVLSSVTTSHPNWPICIAIFLCVIITGYNTILIRLHTQLNNVMSSQIISDTNGYVFYLITLEFKVPTLFYVSNSCDKIKYTIMHLIIELISTTSSYMRSIKLVTVFGSPVNGNIRCYLLPKTNYWTSKVI